ncbi:ATPase [Candidatus Acidianus copahuensis]|uniref:tRNA(Met) cytidine acetyltransferase TmcA n=1 Tax=Candidatus Acidianus copahuensis TaxID=1160895 RepID=A0A031LRW5_9CREN|nr:GNAT family N-acetyltransferase [Candidatus Acidianus copahuensis]EZQ11087.1 ATPase [Candidatus Acidianus copahuensis]
MKREEFLKQLANAIQDSMQRYYRNLVFIESEDYINEVINVLSTYFSIRQEKELSIIYAFHPWVVHSKERRDKIREVIEERGLSFIDVDYSSTDEILGNTYDVVIMDMVDNFQPNYIGRLTDLVRGGGLIIMYTDDLINNKLFRSTLVRKGKVLDFYEERFKRELMNHKGIFCLIGGEYYANSFDGEIVKTEKKNPTKPLMPSILHQLALSEDESNVIDSIKFLIRGGKRIVTITAARGRGKSSATGLGLAGLIHVNLQEDYPTRVIVTAPSLASSSQIMLFLMKGLEALDLQYEVKNSDTGLPGSVFGDGFKVEYRSPDAVIEEEGDTLVVDETASLGMAFLENVIRNWKKLVFVTTVHGYEGSGKTFLKFLNEAIRKKEIAVKWVTMDKPIRYGQNDPIEKWLYDTLLLAAEPKEVSSLDTVVYETVNKEMVFTNDDSLSQLYGILVTAHYRNNPDDLMIMGDGVHHIIKALSAQDSYIGVVQVAEEGELDGDKIKFCLNGGTFDGDLIPDRLLKHSRIIDFGTMKGWRIVRIAITKDLQGKGLGSKLLDMVVNDAKDKGLDWIGSSFMGDPKVLSFWIKNGFIPVHVSPKKNEKFGDFPVVVVKPISERARRSVYVASYILKDKMLNTLHDVYFNMSPELASILISGSVAFKKFDVNKVYLSKALAFVRGISPYESSADAIHALVLKYFWEKRDWSLSREEEMMLVGKVLQGRPWGYLISSIGISRSQASEMIYPSIVTLLKNYYNLEVDMDLEVSVDDFRDEFTTR